MTYQILFWHNGQWVNFAERGREFSVISKKEADFLKSCSITIEDIGRIICYFANEIRWGPPCEFWKVIGPQPETLPSFIRSTYEVVGEETNGPPLIPGCD
jgi:hypothetical protein